ncbi:MAG: hypothetical protein H2172_06385 [Opitutus sp.]|nr:hypothetical protein [Opitutus sp.]MCS6247954.1 hypothetical protein [Opitutus sp.]MCS6275140.1 hypothetical protein [Opitutus sp.]MCS6278584.1 hypothetical protein [Opitutus sp.]MCS6300014.1 hypothetical protein [Opitutus sp.]
MNDERIPWQADDPESGAVQVSGRPVHASWSMLREHFRRVFLEPHRPAGSDMVGWRWLGGSVPRAPEAADLADIRQLLQHALLDITADLERREEDPAITSPRELLAAVKSIVHDLTEGTDIDLGTYAVETDTGWFIRSWGFSHPAPAKLADPSEAVAETPSEAPVAHEAHVEKPPVTKRTKLVRWGAGGVVVLAAAAAVFWFKGSAPKSPAEVQPGQPALASGETHEAPAAEVAHQAPLLPPTAPAAETPAHGEAAAPTGAALGTSSTTVAQAHSAPPGAANEAHSPGFSTAPAPSAQVGGMPVLPGQTGKLGGADATVTTHAETLTTPALSNGTAVADATSAHTAESAGAAGASTPKQARADAAAPLTTAHGGGTEAPSPALGSGTVGLSPEAPPAPAKDTAAGIDAVSLPEIQGKPASAEAADAAPEAAAPAPAPASAVAPKSSEPPGVTEIVWANKTASPPSAENPPPLKFDLTPDALATTLFPPSADANAAGAASSESGASPSGSTAANNAGGAPPSPASAPAASDNPDTAATTSAGATAKVKKTAEATLITYKIGELKVRSFRDPVLATTPAERPSNPMLAEARVQAWAGTQAAKPESFRKPVVNGGWSFRPAKGATWTKHPVWLDTATGKPVNGLRVSENGLHLNWTGLVPTEGFTAHVVDENGIEQARLSISPAERLIEVTTIAVFSESAPTFTVDLTSREAVTGTMVWHSRTPAWLDRRWETQLMERQIRVKCLPTPAIIKEPSSGLVSLSHPASGWALTWEVTTRPTAKSVGAP